MNYIGNIHYTRYRPVRCGQCGNYDYIKVTGINNMVSYKRTMCRLGRLENQKKVAYIGDGKKQYMQLDISRGASRDKKK